MCCRYKQWHWCNISIVISLWLLLILYFSPERLKYIIILRIQIIICFVILTIGQTQRRAQSQRNYWQQRKEFTNILQMMRTKTHRSPLVIKKNPNQRGHYLTSTIDNFNTNISPMRRRKVQLWLAGCAGHDCFQTYSISTGLFQIINNKILVYAKSFWMLNQLNSLIFINI
jgi:hypothetical protein